MEAAWQSFRDSWADLHPLSTARRLEALAQLQPLAELQVMYCCLPNLALRHQCTAGCSVEYADRCCVLYFPLNTYL